MMLDPILVAAIQTLAIIGIMSVAAAITAAIADRVHGIGAPRSRPRRYIDAQRRCAAARRVC